MQHKKSLTTFYTSSPLYKRNAQHLSQVLVTRPQTEACIVNHVLTHFGSGQRLTYTLFLMDLVEHACSNRSEMTESVGSSNSVEQGRVGRGG